jgi:hypothetical protein
MEDRSDAFLGLPGGIGTLEEVFEIWTSRTLNMHVKPVVLLDPEGFYDGLFSWLRGLVGTGFVRAEALSSLTVAASVPEAFDALEAALVVTPPNVPRAALPPDIPPGVIRPDGPRGVLAAGQPSGPEAAPGRSGPPDRR